MLLLCILFDRVDLAQNICHLLNFLLYSAYIYHHCNAPCYFILSEEGENTIGYKVFACSFNKLVIFFSISVFSTEFCSAIFDYG